MNETEEGCFKIVAVPVLLGLVILSALPLALYSGWVLTYLWHWFVVPTFHVQELRIGYATGITLTVRHIQSSSYCDDRRKWKDRIMGWVFFPLATLFFGYLIHWWVT